MTELSRARVRDPERRERILGAAASLIAQRGYPSVSLGDIGSAAGIVGSGVYRHFDSKSAILIEMLDRVVDQLVANAERELARSSDPVGILTMLVRGHVQFTITERHLCQVYEQEARNLPDGDYRRLRWKQRHYVDLWEDVLRSVHRELTAAEAKVLVGAAISAIHSALRYTTDLPQERLAEVLEVAACRTLGIARAS